MNCERFAQARVLAAYGEATDHVEGCDSCRGEVDEMREVRRLYAERPARNLTLRSRNRIVAALRRQSSFRRLRAAAMAAVMLVAVALAQAARNPVETVRPEPVPSGALVDFNVTEVRDRISDLEWDARPVIIYLDAALDDVARRIELLSWDAESM